MTEVDLVEALRAALKDGPTLAGDLASKLGVARSDVNPILYRRSDLFRNDGSSPPQWMLVRVDLPQGGPERAPRSKGEALQTILDVVGSDAELAIGPGSTEPKALFLEVDRHLSLGLDRSLSKVELARGIVAAAGLTWPNDGDSTNSPSGGGDTVTLAGHIAVLQAARALSTGTPRVAPRRVIERTLPGIPYVEATGGIDAPPALVDLDWDGLDRATRAHAQLQNAVAAAIRTAGLEPLSPGPDDPQFDIAWQPRGRFVVCEVKSANLENVRQQARLGLGQVLDYRESLRQAARLEVLAVLVLTLPPPSVVVKAALSVGVRLVAADGLSAGLSPLT